METNKQYLGDGVYASFDGYHIILGANLPETDVIFLDPNVVAALEAYIKRLHTAPESDTQP